MRASNDTLISAVNATTTSAAVPWSQVLSFSMVAVSTGTITGTAQVQVSNDKVTPTNWVNLAGASIAVAAPATQLLAKTEVVYNFARVVFTKTGGNGAATIIIQSMAL